MDEAPKLFDVEEALPIEHLSQYLTAYVKAFPNVMLWYDFSQPIDLKVHQIMNTLVSDTNSSAVKVDLINAINVTLNQKCVNQTFFLLLYRHGCLQERLFIK